MTCGLVCNKDRKAPSDSDTVALYKKAGAIAVTVTNVPILCMWWESANHNFGMTKNPYDHRRTVGGSSGKFYFFLFRAFQRLGTHHPPLQLH